MSRIYNFNPGPATLPLEVLEQAREELPDYQGLGMSVMEISHRSKDYEAINSEAEARIKKLAGVGEDYRVLFVQGGASLQFAQVPLNFSHSGKVPNYILTGSWSDKALSEANKVGPTHVAASTKDAKYTRIPRGDEIQIGDNAAYVHITTNNTITGTQWHTLPDVGDAPLIADASSDILSRPFPAERFAMLYAGAQKNLGPAGVTVLLLRESLMEQESAEIPVFLRYSTHAKADSLYNTPPAFGVYMVNLVTRWIEKGGGLPAMEQHNQQKAQLLYSAIDESGGFYHSPIAADSRSMMNVVFRLPSEDLEKQFISEASAAGMIGLKGHRSVGGIRASIYNAMSIEGCEALTSFMGEFARTHG
jgi:phosphoserine aminotransferase